MTAATRAIIPRIWDIVMLLDDRKSDNFGLVPRSTSVDARANESFPVTHLLPSLVRLAPGYD